MAPNTKLPRRSTGRTTSSSLLKREDSLRHLLFLGPRTRARARPRTHSSSVAEDTCARKSCERNSRFLSLPLPLKLHSRVYLVVVFCNGELIDGCLGLGLSPASLNPICFSPQSAEDGKSLYRICVRYIHRIIIILLHFWFYVHLV